MKFQSGSLHPMKLLENRIKSSKAHQGQKPWNTGKAGTYKLSDQTRKLMSESHKKIYPIWSVGRPAWNKGIPHSESTRTKLKIARRSRVFPRKDSKPERILQFGLILNKIIFEKHKAIIGQPDIFIEPNICIFVDGDYIHANPNKYNHDDYIIHGRLAGDIWARDSYVNNELKILGYKVLRFWESDIKKDVNICAENIMRVM